jgi:hypothetical protein
MKTLKTLLLLIFTQAILFAGISNAATYYVSTTGSDSNPGTIDQPFKTFQKIGKLSLNPGDIVYIRAGIYKSGATSNSPQSALLIDGKNGNSSNWITIAAYPADFVNGGRVVLDCSDFKHTSDYVGIQIQNSSYLTIKGIRVTGIPQAVAGQVCLGWFILNNAGGNITLENCEADHIAHNGFRHHNTSNMTYLNCDAHHIDNPYDPGIQQHGGADGFGCYDISNTSQNTLYKNCRAWFCSDDGWDVNNAPGTITYDGCWAFWSGYVQDVFPLTHTQGGVNWGDGNGFKLGGDATPKDYTNTKRFVKRCFSFENYKTGFDQNVANVKMEFYNNTAYKNGQFGFFFYTQAPAPNIVYNNITYQNVQGTQNFIASVTTQSNNSWNTTAPATGDFLSLVNTGVDGTRQADGSLPNLNILHLSSASKLVDAGINVNLPFLGKAPDLGAFESGGVVNNSNLAPVADAGTDQIFFLPTNSTTLNGTATDPDGSIASYLWTKISGPAQFTIASPSSAKTGLSNLVQGVYRFELKATDNSGASDADTVAITVNAPANQPPVANAGSNKTITLPSNSVTLDGSNSKDTDGSITAYSWSKVSGPSQGTISNATNVSSTATSLVEGTYIFKLTVTDNNSATASDSVTIIVNAAFNQPPVANAGANQTITLPVNSVTLNGSATDADGTISSYSWSKSSGPASGSITSSTSSGTTVTNLVQGVYVFKLTVKDNGNSTSSDSVTVIVNAIANKLPVANAGANKSITLPVNTVNLDGSASSDPDGALTGFTWLKVSGPSQGAISNTTSATTTATGLVQGNYVFKLTVKDNSNATASDSVIITVNSAPNLAPVANAGGDKVITLPVNSVTIEGSASVDADGSISSYSWVKISGPTQGSITGAGAALATATNLVQGTYTFKLTVTDNNGVATSDTVSVTVNPAVNQPPVADAGNNQTITLPANSVILNGSASSDPDGTIVSYAWVKTAGNTATISNATSKSTTAGNLQAGQYTFELTVIDNSGASSKKTVRVTVLSPADQSPVADAGSAQTITLPVNSVTLDGSASLDPDGTISSYAWSKLSGPAQGNIASSNKSVTTASGLLEGIYVFKLIITDNSGKTASDSVKVTVNAVANLLPTANAGSSQTIALPVNSATLNGSASSDPDGSIISYKWVKLSGGTATIANSAASTTTLSGLVAGQYTFELTVTDDKGASSKAQVKIKVNSAPNKSPEANAGPNKNISKPANSTTLDGSASSDPDGTIVSFSWSKIAGGSGTISNANTATASVSGLSTGQYIFELTVTDDKGASSKAQVKVVVSEAANQPPVANAGDNQTLPFGTLFVTLDGSKSTDPDGSIAVYKWVLISGSGVTVSDSTNVKPTVSGLKGGQYIFELTVTDNGGATSTAQVKVIVNLSANQPPVADAGANQVLILPVSSVKLDATHSYDPDGTVAFYNWVKTAGPSSVTITNVNTSTPVISGLTEGQYTFELTVTDNRGASTKAQVKVNVQQPVNQPPVADAGNDQTIILPSNNNRTASVSLDGTRSFDTDGNIVFYTWKKIEGVSAVTIDNVNTSLSMVSGLKAGEYTFELTVTDNNGASATDRITIFVKPATSQPVTADAGQDLTINAPVSTATLDGRGSSADQGSLTYKWEQVQGPSASAISFATTSQPAVKNLLTGVYIFKLSVTNNRGESASDEVKVTVVDGATNFAQVDLYPNPASDVVNATITSDSIGTVGLNIYDLNGRVVKKMELNKQLVDNLRQQVQRRNVNSNQPNTTQPYFTLPINIASLGKGVYILETIIDKRTRVTAKFIKY